MDKFSRLVYKDKEYQERRPEEPTLEQLQYSEKVAKEKLEKIMDSRFKVFAVRYMNIEEYRLMLEETKFGGRDSHEVTTHGRDQDPELGEMVNENFIDFLKDAQNRAGAYTDWRSSAVQQKQMRSLLHGVRDIERQSKADGKNDKLLKIREKILKFMNFKPSGFSTEEIFHPRLWRIYKNKDSESILSRIDFLSDEQLKSVKSEELFYFSRDVDIFFEHEFENRVKEGKLPNLTENQKELLLDYLLARGVEVEFGEENSKVLRKLKSSPSYITEPGALREVMNALSYAMDHHDSKNRQFQVAVVLDDDIFEFGVREYRDRKWGSFALSKKFQSLSDVKKKKGLLAAISIVPLKDLYKEMVELERGSGDFAHPIFDNQGVLRWPKAKGDI